jgi:diguanylate cyclase (GGDEF)-like protein
VLYGDEEDSNGSGIPRDLVVVTARWSVWTLLLMLLAAGPRVAKAATALPAITNAMGVRSLPPSQASKELAVRIRAVITYANVSNGELFVQDSSAGIFIFIRDSKSSGTLRAGQLVDVEGVTAPGDFSSSITKATIRVVGEAGMPKPLHANLDRLLTGAEDSQWGEAKGVVRSGRVSFGVLSLSVVAGGGSFLVFVKDFPEDWETRLIDAKITFEGVLAAAFNEHRQAVGMRMFLPGSSFMHIDDPAPRSPFDLPLASAVSVGAFRINPDESRRIRVRATVTATLSRSLIYVSDGEGNLPVEMDLPGSTAPGDLLEIVGFPGAVDGRPGLKNAVWRLMAKDRDLQPAPLLAQDILPPEDQTAGSGLAIAAGTRYDLKLVSLEGTLLQSGGGAHSRIMTLTASDRIFTATIPDSAQQLAEELEIGSHLKVTGVCLINYDEYHRAQSFRLLVRRPGDITVQWRPAWWTLRHALWLVGFMLLSVIGAVTWITLLRKQVAIRTDELRELNERLHRVATEDGLTGAANRRRFDELLRIEFVRAIRAETPLSLVMIDVDHFKALNDRYGHQTGDQCLIKVVEAIRRSAGRGTDIVARYGGEEFAVILPDAGDQAAIALAEAMREAVESVRIPDEDAPEDQVLTVSLGVGTLWPGSTYTADDLVGFADRALYHAKQSGRNRVSSWATVEMEL